MKLNALFLALAATMCVSVSTQMSPANATPEKGEAVEPIVKPVDPIVAAANRFGFKLLAEIHRQNPDANIFLSPPSLALALGVAWSGARGETRQEMARCLEFEGLDGEAGSSGYAGLLRSIHPKEPGVTLEVATSLWVAPGKMLRRGFLEHAATRYDAQVMQLEQGDTAERINAWVRDETHGKIDSVFDILPPELVLDIVNAVYFKGTWVEPFDPKATRDRPFHLPAGRIEPLPMMSRSGAFPYLDGEGFRSVALPYGEDAIRFHVVLPDSGSNLTSLVATLSRDESTEWVQKLQSTRGEVILPSFTMDWDMMLNNVLSNLGMRRAFDGMRADFSGIGDGPLFISRVMHKSWIEVNERGTEAAAATGIEVTLGAARVPAEPPFRLLVDRPFFFAIRDRFNGLVLFCGIMNHPQRI
jgi:serpin B